MKHKIVLQFVFIFMITFSSTKAQDWQLLGNGGTSPTTDFVGTTDAQPLNISTNSTSVGASPQPIYFNTLGSPLMTLYATGDLDLSIATTSFQINGDAMLWHNSRTSNLFVGVDAGNQNATYLNCTFVGNLAGNANTYSNPYGGMNNTFVGANAGIVNTTGGYNTFVGADAGFNCTTGPGNTLIGASAGYNITSLQDGNYDNTFVGYYAGYLTTAGTHNTFLGDDAGRSNDDGDENVYVGSHSGYNNVHGYRNVFVGSIDLGTPNQLGNYNTFIGYNAGDGTTPYENSTALGAWTVLTADNQMILGGNTSSGPHTGYNEVNVGIGLSNDGTFNGPRSKLEINADVSSTAYTGSGGSGLQFRQLTDAATPAPNTGLGVLSVDIDGKVVYVENTGLGNYCGASLSNPLNGDYEIPLDNGTNSFDYHFTGQQDGSTDVIVGSTCGNGWPYAKFQSLQFTDQTGAESNAGLFYNSTKNRFAVGAVGVSEQSKDNNFGLKGFAKLDAGTANYGVFGTTTNFPVMLAGNMNVGVYGYTKTSTLHSGATLRFGVIGDLGIAGPCVPPPCPVTFPDWAGYFNGDVAAVGGYFVVSDSTLKQNIQDMNDPISLIAQLNPKSYEFRNDQFESMQLPRGTHYGFLSQEVESVMPDIVKDGIHPERTDSLGNMTHDAIEFKSLNYVEIIPILVGAIKEQQQTIEAMQSELAMLNGGGNRQGHHASGEGDNRANNNQDPTHSIDVELSNSKAIILNQNVPNPFAEQTSISYFLTEDVSKAQIFFYDNKGTVLKIVDINERGPGNLNVFAADLSSGNYIYTLIADGKVIESKTMVKQ